MTRIVLSTPSAGAEKSRRNREREMADYLDPKAPSLARTLKQAGYATAHFGKWHMGGGRDVDDAPHPKAYGFDESLVSFEGLGDRILLKGQKSAKLGQGKIRIVSKYEKTQVYVDRAIQFIHKNKDKPFYINLWPNDVHDAHVPRPELADKYKHVTDDPFKQKFYAVLYEMDRQLGRVIDEIDQLGLKDKTLIVFTSDNGPTDWAKYYNQGAVPPGSAGPFRGRKWSLYEGGIRMPLIARWGGKVPVGKVDETSVMCGVDMFKTMCALAGVELPAGVSFDGEDMSRAILGVPVKRKKSIYWEYPRRPGLKPGKAEYQSPKLAIREGNWKLLTNDDGEGSELYDLSVDIGETKNLFAQEKQVAQRLLKKLLVWRKALP